MRFKKVFSSVFHGKTDHELCEILKKETKRQLRSLELIASENFTSKPVLKANGSIFTNKYAEGYPGKRYYGGCENIDLLERLAQDRALNAFNVDTDKWGVNVQAYSGSPANFAVYTAVLKPGERLMGLSLPSGGHLTHGYQTANKKISSSSIFFESQSYSVDSKTLLIDYDQLEVDVVKFRPKLLIVGGSAYTRDYNYSEFRRIADMVGARLLADISHTAGLIACELLNSPFLFCDVVTTTTHKTLRGPRGALIFYKKELQEQIDFALFPGCQGGPHCNTIAAIATALFEVATPEFVEYSRKVISNSKYLASVLKSYGFTVITGGTDNHIILVNTKDKGITGSKIEKLCEKCSVSINKNMIATDSSAQSPSGIRLGTPAMTTRGFENKHFETVAKILNDITLLGIDIQSSASSNKLTDFEKEFDNYLPEIKAIQKVVNQMCRRFPLP